MCLVRTHIPKWDIGGPRGPGENSLDLGCEGDDTRVPEC